MNNPQREEFFNQLYNKYNGAIFAYILSHVNQREMAKDLLQEAFLRIWNHIHVGLELGVNESRHWIYRISKNLIIDYYRRKSTQSRMQQRIQEDKIVHVVFSQSAEDSFEIKEQIVSVEQAIRRLPEDLYRVLMLKLVGQMNSSHIGELLDIPAGTVRYRLSMARKQLRQELTQAQEEGTRI